METPKERVNPINDNRHLLDPWENLVQKIPDTTAVVEMKREQTWTFRLIDDASRKWEEKLHDSGRRLRGLPVAFQLANGGDWIARFLALLRVGAAALPIDQAEPESNMRKIADQCGAAIWTANGNLKPPVSPRFFRAPLIALVKLTSGTSGIPTTLPFRTKELAADGKNILAGMKISGNDRNFAVIPFGHSYGFGNLVMPLLLAGTPIVCGSDPLPHILADEFTKSGTSVLPAVPAIFRGLVRADVQLPKLRLAISAGAPLQPKLAKAFLKRFGKPIHNFYGTSETGGIAFDQDGSATLAGRAIGKALPGVTITLSQENRICISSKAVFTRGNRYQKGGVGEFLLSDTGDSTPHNELILRGRGSRVVKIGARRLDLSEIESALTEIPEIGEVWTTVVKSQNEERPAAIVESNFTAKEIRQKLRNRLAIWKIPRPLIVVATFPLTARGKPDREKLLHLLQTAQK